MTSGPLNPHDLGCRCNNAAGLSQNRIKVVVTQRKLTEVGKYLLPLRHLRAT